ncbi:DNA polymerase III subunit gamma/tau [Ruoffia sp. FAM 26255]|uniref:DNA polymerase III subunit gamma/tau n=1 Tax=Ruoffia sp. FAM 26255 TaxID=3259519 RepID=UPI000EC59057|nr:DNA polymerase III subunit gamma/tau [Aerococcaceae bacterium]
MSYQALYRVWRPQTFDEMVGQPIIKETLKNAIKSNHISHAYLFTGPRGTGKTSAAKILAKAINCPNQTDGNPCNNCDMCRLITEGQLGDVVEIDAASNNGVDEIRELRENVRYAASQARYKVYIIDEVHMLTTAAFNALLKTLEEPPEQVVFILATTEAHKIPATILSRTQRFDFQLYTDQELIGRMEEILNHDNIDYDEEALAIIARSANGGMRDTVSLLDQAISFNTEEVTVETALEVSGSLNQMALLNYIQTVFRQNIEEALEIVNDQLQKGKQAARFIDELILFSRDMLLTLHIKQNQTLLSEQEIQPLREEVPANFYYVLIDTLNETQGKMRFSTSPNLYIEVMTIQLAQTDKKQLVSGRQQANTASAPNEAVNGALMDTVRQLEEKLAALSQQVQSQDKLIRAYLENQPTNQGVQPINQEGNGELTNDAKPVAEEAPKVPRKRPARQQARYKLRLNHVYRVLNTATHQHIRLMKEHWPAVLDELSPQQRAKFFETEPLAAGEGSALISFPNPAYAGDVQHGHELMKFIEETVEQKTGMSMKIILILASEWADVRKNYAMLRKKNNGAPIPIEEDETDNAEETVEVETIAESEVPDNQTDTEEVVDEQATSTQEVSEKTQETRVREESAEAPAKELQESNHSMDSLEASLPNSTRSIDDIFSQEGSPSHRAMELDNNEPEEEEGPPEIVSKAIELFGEENVNIYYDR